MIQLQNWFITMKVIEFFHTYSKLWLDEVRAEDDASISLVSNSSTYFANGLLSNTVRCNNCLESFCIIFGGILRTKMMGELT